MQDADVAVDYFLPSTHVLQLISQHLGLSGMLFRQLTYIMVLEHIVRNIFLLRGFSSIQA